MVAQNIQMKYVKQAEWIEIKKELWDESPLGNPQCGYCKKKKAKDLAHAIIHKRYSSKYRTAITVKENAVPCCEDCQKFSETRDGRVVAWIWLCLKYGGQHMKTWYNRLPFEVTEEYDELR